MGIRLRFLSWWTPEWFQGKGLDELSVSTIEGLENVLQNNTKIDESSKIVSSSPNNTSLKANLKEKDILNENLHEKRRIMAETHNELVKRMIKTYGYDIALEKGREEMFSKGLSLGQKFRKMLGVGDSQEDLIRAAGILYKVLGINFIIEENENKEMIMIVNHCALAEYYTPETCQILSAADEGVVQGLNPQITINFHERITQGAPCCLASIKKKDVTK